jgi:hypothetical protein
MKLPGRRLTEGAAAPPETSNNNIILVPSSTATATEVLLENYRLTTGMVFLEPTMQDFLGRSDSMDLVGYPDTFLAGDALTAVDT